MTTRRLVAWLLLGAWALAVMTLEEKYRERTVHSFRRRPANPPVREAGNHDPF